MVGKDSDEKIQRITKLLEKENNAGNTSWVWSPNVRYQGKITCPVCDFQEKKQINESGETAKQQIEKSKPGIEPAMFPGQSCNLIASN